MFVVSVRERGKEEHKFTFRKPEIVIGRLRSNDIILPKRNISKRHAKLELTDDNQIVLRDNGSTNGSYINGKKLLEPTVVGIDDKIFVGDYILQARIIEDRSAIDGVDGEVVPMMDGDAGEHQDRPTVADVDASLLEEELQRREAETSNAGPETVVVDPLEVPSEPPDDLELPSVEAGFDALPDELPVDVVEEEELDAETMRLKDAAQLAEEASVELEEELLDIPLMVEEEADAPPAPVAEPTPEPIAMPEPVERRLPTDSSLAAFAPSVSRLESGLSAALDQQYELLAAQFDQWVEGKSPNKAQILEKVGELLIDALGETIGNNLDDVTEQVASELTYIGAVATLLEDPKVGEVFVASSGQILTYDWRGEAVETGASLSCPAACQRLAHTIAGGEESGGFAEGRLPDGTLARALMDPVTAQQPCLRFVRPYRTTMSLAKLQETGVAAAELTAKLTAAIQAGRSILVTGPHAPTLSLIVHSAAAAIDRNARVAVCGDRFAIGTALDNFAPFDADSLQAPHFSDALGAMGFDWLVLENAPGDNALAAVEMCTILQMPCIVSARLNNPTNLGALGGLGEAQTREALYYLLDANRVIIATAGYGTLESLYLFTLEDGAPKLVPFTP